MSVSAIPIPKYRFHEPRHNLPGRKGTATAEDRFTIAFMREYFSRNCAIHRRSTKNRMAFAREIPVNGYGIADLLVVAWDDSPEESYDDLEDFIRYERPRTRAFECKMIDWRKAMTQAVRYRFFANQAIVILPDSISHRALPYIETFRKIRVGLWSFNIQLGRITTYHTPRPSKPISERYHLQAIRVLKLASKQALPIL